MLRVPALLFLIVFAIRAVLAVWGNMLGYDLPFHLANGREIVTTGSISHGDPFLAPLDGMPPHHFPNYEWLFGVVSWGIFQGGGYTAIEWFRLGLIAAIFFVIGVQAWKATARSSAAPALRLMIVTVVLILGFTAAGRRFEPRPHLVSGLGLALLALVLDGRKIAWSHVALLLGFGLAWANCHIEVLLGLGFCLLETFFTGLATATGWSDAEQRDGPAKAAPRVVLILGLLAAILASPASWRMFTQAVDYYSHLAVVMEKYKFVNIEITPIESGWWFQPFGLLLALSFLGLFLGDGSPEDRRAALRHTATVPFWLLPFLSNRHLLPAAVFLIPACGAAMERILRRIPDRFRAPGLLLLVPLTMAWCFPTYGNPAPPHPEIGIRPDRPLWWHPARSLPEGTVRFLGLHGLGGRIFCPDRWGSFLLLSSRLASETANVAPLQPFIHNMIQAYPLQRLEEYLRILTRPDESLGRLDRHGIDLVLLGLPESLRDEEFLLSRRLRQSPQWRLVFWDDLGVLYARRALVASHAAIRPFAIVDPPLLVLDEMAMSRLASATGGLAEELSRARIASSGVEAINTALWLAGRLEQEGDLEGAISVLRDLLSRHPRAWPIHSKLGILLSRNGQRAAGISSLEQVRQINPRHAPSLFNLAVAYFSSGQVDLALQRLDEARLADPGFLPARELEKKITEGPPLNHGDVRGNLKKPFSKGQMP